MSLNVRPVPATSRGSSVIGSVNGKLSEETTHAASRIWLGVPSPSQLGSSTLLAYQLSGMNVEMSWSLTSGW